MKNEELLKLEQTVDELTSWKNSRKRERLVNPIDTQSRKAIINNPTINYRELPVFTGRTFPSFKSIITDLTGYGMEVRINNDKRFLLVTPHFLRFSANSATSVFTATDGQHNFKNGDILDLTTTDTLPAGLDTITDYYVINGSGTTFQLSLTFGGSPVTISDVGVGTHYYINISNV